MRTQSRTLAPTHCEHRARRRDSIFGLDGRSGRPRQRALPPQPHDILARRITRAIEEFERAADEAREAGDRTEAEISRSILTGRAQRGDTSVCDGVACPRSPAPRSHEQASRDVCATNSHGRTRKACHFASRRERRLVAEGDALARELGTPSMRQVPADIEPLAGDAAKAEAILRQEARAGAYRGFQGTT